jgi:hypothetical protein
MPGGSNLSLLSTFVRGRRRDRETPGFTARLALNFPAVGDAIEQETLGFTAGGFLYETRIPGRETAPERYSVAKLIERHGDAKLTDLLRVLAACPRERSTGIHDRCKASTASCCRERRLARKSRRTARKNKAQRAVYVSAPFARGQLANVPAPARRLISAAAAIP